MQPLCVYSLWDHLKAFEFNLLTIRVYAAQLVRYLDVSHSTGTTLKPPSLQVSGLEALHEMRIIHCDLKPDNILVSPSGHLLISDFGLSVSWLDPRYRDHPSHAFRGRRLAGTDGYMAPEIISAPRQARRGNFGFPADIWGLGVVIAELGMRGRHFVAYEDEEEEQGWKDFGRFSRTVTLSREMLMKRVDRHLRGDHAMLVERVRVILS